MYRCIIIKVRRNKEGEVREIVVAIVILYKKPDVKHLYEIKRHLPWLEDR